MQWCASRRLALTRRRWSLLRQQLAVEDQEDRDAVAVVDAEHLDFEVWCTNRELRALDWRDRARELPDNWDQGGLATQLDEDPTPLMPRPYRGPLTFPRVS